MKKLRYLLIYRLALFVQVIITCIIFGTVLLKIFEYGMPRFASTFDILILTSFFVMMIAVLNFCVLNIILAYKKYPAGELTRGMNRYFLVSWCLFLFAIIFTGVVTVAGIKSYSDILSAGNRSGMADNILWTLLMLLAFILAQVYTLFTSVKLRKVIRENNYRLHQESLDNFATGNDIQDQAI